MATFQNASGINFDDLRSPSSRLDPEARKIALDLPKVPNLPKDNPSEYDLVFICKDGIVLAHRLVIANASKYIRHMLADQPPWYWSYIHVLDLPKKILQLLVDLAYTGEMILSENIQSEVFDAMQTLGWVHTDCLSAHYDTLGESYADHGEYPKSPEKEKSLDRRESSQSVSKEQGVDRNSFADDEDPMEISQLPELDVSDVDDDSVAITGAKKGVKKQSPPVKKSVGRPRKEKTEDNKDAHQPLKDSKQEPKGKRGRKGTGKEDDVAEKSNKTAPEKDNSKKSNETTVPASGRRGRKPKVSVTEADKCENSSTTGSIKEDENKDDTEELEEQNNVETADLSSAVEESPSKRQRRKPKRFEEYEELDKPKPRSPAKPAIEQKSGGAKGKNVQTDGATSSKNGNESMGKDKQPPKRKISDAANKNSLITSFFKKESLSNDNQKQEPKNNGEREDANGTTSESETEADEVVGTRNVAKRTFDEIMSSCVPDKATNPTSPAGPIKPARKSSRVASKQSNEGDEEDAETPARKRPRKSTTNSSDTPDTENDGAKVEKRRTSTTST